MMIDEIVAEIDDGGPKSYYSFEIFVQHLLKGHIENQHKTLQFMTDFTQFGDAFAPDGFDQFDGATLIEIKFNLSNISFRYFIDMLLRGVVSKYSGEAPRYVLVISAKPVGKKFLFDFNEEIKRHQLPFEVVIWGPPELDRIAAKNKGLVSKIASNIFALRISAAISKAPKDWKQERIEIIDRLRLCYKKGQFSIFLGAGVSSSAGMPDWNTLLNSLFVTYLTKEFDGAGVMGDRDVNELVARLNSINEPSALMAARYLRKGLSRNDDETKGFIAAVTENLYKLRKVEFSIDSELVKSIASMCLPRRTGAKVKSVVTYNFDDLLERQLSKNSIMYRCIYTDSESYDPDELPVYHVHGFLPEDRNSYDGLDNSTLIFSEESYHRIYSDSYHWSNLVQLNSLRESSCLMIGLSMTDPNLRRLLDISSKNIEESKHFAFMKRLSLDEFCYENPLDENSKVVANIESAGKFLECHHTLNEELMKELGVTIIWYEKYDDIPEIIKTVVRRES